MTDLAITATDVALIESIEQKTAPAAEAITAGQVVRLDSSTGKFTPANASASGEARAFGLALTNAAAGITLTAVKRGLVNLGDALDGLDYDADVFLADSDGTLADAVGAESVVVGKVDSLFGYTTADKVLRVDL